MTDPRLELLLREVAVAINGKVNAEAEVLRLRAELAELRKQLEAAKAASGVGNAEVVAINRV